ncbi:MAG: hypothetical protein ACE1Z4_00015 [Gammaproteobacteria bacterium]
MLNRHKHWLTGIIVGLTMPVISIYAADESEASTPGRWSATATAGLMIWSDLKDLEPAAGGGFDSVGIVVELAGHKHIARWGSADVLIGVDLGIFATQSDIPGITEDFTQRGLYLTPSMKFRFGERSRRYLNLEAGLGWYQVDIAELICDDDNLNNIVCIEIAEPFDEDTLGGYLGITGGFGSGFIMGLKVHFANFGTVTGLGPDTGELKRPIYIFSLGGAFGG